MDKASEYHMFNCGLAAEVGIGPAILFQNIAYWVRRNAANGRHIHDGRAWTYNSGKAFASLFFYLPQRTIEAYLYRLEKDGYLLSRTDLNEHAFNRTKWYTVGPAGEPWQIVDASTAIRLADSANVSADSANDNKEADINTDSKPPKKKGRAPFQKPTPEEVTAYAKQIGFPLDGQVFVDHYESKDWMIGKSPMKNWQAAVRTWKNRAKLDETPQPETPEERIRRFEEKGWI